MRGQAYWSQKFTNDERGSTLIQFVLVLPVFVLLLYGSYEVYKVLVIKQSLDAGTYQAARYLSVAGRDIVGSYPHSWRNEAWVIVADELSHTPYLPPDTPFDVAINPPFRPICPTTEALQRPLPDLRRALFTVSAGVEVPWPVRIPFLQPERLTLVAQHTTYLECSPLWVGPTPTPTTEVP